MFSTNGFSGKSRRPREMPLRAKDDETPAPRKFTLERAEGSSLPCRHQTRHRCHPAPRGSLFLDPDRLAQSPRRRELSAVGARLSAETGLPYLQPATGEQVAGAYRQSLTLTSRRFATIDNGLGFQLVPWSPPLEKQLGRHVSGLVRDGGGIEWAMGRKRGIEF